MSFTGFEEFLNSHPLAREALIALVLIIAGVAAYHLVKRYILRLINYALKRTQTTWDDILMDNKVFNVLAFLAPALVFFYGLRFFPAIRDAGQRVLSAYMFFLVILFLDRLLSSGLAIYETFEVAKRKPMKGYVQIVKLFFYLLGGVVVVCILINRSPWGILSGIGALTAVLLFVFRDTILGFIASIQLVTNDLVRVGDWIEVPQFGADGDVIDMALHTVKVQNWDKTITSIPTYKLMEGSFKNWRGMMESGGRRIKRSILIDTSSISFLTGEMKEKLRKIQVLKDYIEKREAEIEAWNKERNIDPSVVVNGRRMTNIGTFRAYVSEYLKNNEKIHRGLTFLVRQLAPTSEGLPIEIYVFTSDTAWANYEGIQADIFDHLLAAIPEFGLRVYQAPSGHDLAKLAAR